jgi:hypothetical protein
MVAVWNDRVWIGSELDRLDADGTSWTNWVRMEYRRQLQACAAELAHLPATRGNKTVRPGRNDGRA